MREDNFSELSVSVVIVSGIGIELLFFLVWKKSRRFLKEGRLSGFKFQHSLSFEYLLQKMTH